MPQDAQEEFAQWRPQAKVAGGWGISSKQCGGWADRGEEEEHLGMAKATVLHQAGGGHGTNMSQMPILAGWDGRVEDCRT